MSLRFSLKDILFLTAILCFAVRAYCAPTSRTDRYNDLLLRYQRPTIPKEFLDMGRPAPTFDMGAGTTEQYESGSDLYLSNHWIGFICVTYPFMDDKDDWDEVSRADLTLDNLPTDRWDHDHFEFAFKTGRDQALDTINRQILHFGESELRNRLSEIPWYRERLGTLWGLATISLVFGWVLHKI